MKHANSTSTAKPTRRYHRTLISMLASVVVLSAGSVAAYDATTSSGDSRSGVIEYLTVDDVWIVVDLNLTGTGGSAKFPACTSDTNGTAFFPITDSNEGQRTALFSTLLSAQLTGRAVSVRAKERTIAGASKCVMDWVQLAAP